MVGGVAAEKQNPGFRSGMFPQNRLNNAWGVPYTWGSGFSDAYTPSEFLNKSAAGTAEKNRRKSLTSDQYGRGLLRKKASTSKKASTPKKESTPPVQRSAPSSSGGEFISLGIRRRGSAQKRSAAPGRSRSKSQRFSTG